MAAMDEELNDENLNDRLNDQNLNNQNLNSALNNKKVDIARLHALVLFTLDTVIIILCLLFLIWFFLETIITINQYNSDHQDTGCITYDCKDIRFNDSDHQETTIVKTSCIARDCKELYEQGHTCSGVYTIKPDKLPAFEVYCDMSNGSGWTVFQRRMDGSVTFNLTWANYLKGFGDLNGEFWLGLDKIHRLTGTGNTSLRVDLKDFEGVSVFAHYSTFIVGDAHTNYKLTVGGYSGNANDSLSCHNNTKFSTHDRDNDKYNGNCAVEFEGAWWYHMCHDSNLNGRYLAGIHSTYANGVNWLGFKGYHYSLKVSEMKVNRK